MTKHPLLTFNYIHVSSYRSLGLQVILFFSVNFHYPSSELVSAMLLLTLLLALFPLISQLSATPAGVPS